MAHPPDSLPPPLGLFIQPACLQHRYIRHPNSSHIFERPERLRAVLLGVAAAVARLEEAHSVLQATTGPKNDSITPSNSITGHDLSSMLSGLSIQSSFLPPDRHLHVVPPPQPPAAPGQVLLHHRGLQLAHSPPPESGFPLPGSKEPMPSSPYLKDLLKWASEAVERIRETGCEIPAGLGLNQGDLYLGPGSVLAIEGAIQTVCQAIDQVCVAISQVEVEPSTPPVQTTPPKSYMDNHASVDSQSTRRFKKAFCAIRPPGHHCGEGSPSGFCYVNNVVTGAMHAYLEHDIDRAVIIDFDLHHGNGTQALVMPLNAASHADDLAVKAGKPPTALLGKNGKPQRGWKGFYGSVHDIYSYPCEDGDLDLISDASINLAAHGQYIENIHLQPYTSEADFYTRIYPLYLALLSKAANFLAETSATPDRTLIFISAGFDACEHEYPAMQRHDRRVPTSFFSRYTRDIAAFADKWAEGKVVSVLEGGYSDRALTSAGMGHVIGMLGLEGEPSWWEEAELANIEKATKKKRTGKLALFPAELSHLPHLARTHALLAHFEGGPGSNPPDSVAPSVANTPQGPGSRMTLRDRRKQNGEDENVTPPAAARRGGRGTPRGKVAVEGTPLRKAVVGRSPTRASGQGSSSSTTTIAPATGFGLPSVKAAGEGLPPSEGLHWTRDGSVEDATRRLGGVSLDSILSIPQARQPDPPPDPAVDSTREAAPALSNLPPPPPLFTSATQAAPLSAEPAPTAPAPLETAQPSKIMLRFARPTAPTNSTLPAPSPPQPALPPPLPPPSADALYPALPPLSTSRAAQDPVIDEQRLAYREGSAGAMSAVTDGDDETEGEYASALSGSEVGGGGGGGRGGREGTGESGGSASGMPGAFGQ